MALLAKTFNINSNSAILLVTESDGTLNLSFSLITLKNGLKVAPGYPQETLIQEGSSYTIPLLGLDPETTYDVTVEVYDKDYAKVDSVSTTVTTTKTTNSDVDLVEFKKGAAFNLKTTTGKIISGVIDDNGKVYLSGGTEEVNVPLVTLQKSFSDALESVNYLHNENTKQLIPNAIDPFVEFHQDGDFVSGAFFNYEGIRVSGVNSKGETLPKGIELLEFREQPNSMVIIFSLTLTDPEVVALVFEDLIRPEALIIIPLEGFTLPTITGPTIDSFTALEDPAKFGTLNVSYEVTDASRIVKDVKLTYNSGGPRSKDYKKVLSITDDVIEIGEGKTVSDLLLTVTSSKPDVTSAVSDVVMSVSPDDGGTVVSAPVIKTFKAVEAATFGTLNISYNITDASNILTNVTLTYDADGVAKSKDYGTSLSKTNDAIILGEGVVVTNLLLTATSSEPDVTKTAPDLTLSTTVPTTNAPVITTFTAVEDAIFGTLNISYIITDADAITTNVTLSYDADGIPATKDYLTSLTKTNDPIIIGEGVVVSNLLLTVKSTEPDVTKTAPNVTLSTSTPAVLAPSITTFTFVENATTFGDVDYAYEVLDSDAITTGISLTYTVDGTPATAIDLGVALTGGATITVGEGAVITVPLLTVSSSEPDVTKSAPGITLSTTPVVPTALVITTFTVVNNATTPGNVDVDYTITDPDNEVTNIKIDYLLDTVAGTGIDLGVVLTGSNTYTTVPGTVISGIVMTVTTTSSGDVTQTAPDLTVTTA